MDNPNEPGAASLLTPTERSRVRRVPSRASYDRAVVHAILDGGLVAHVGLVSEGQPFVIPMAYARVEGDLILHGAPASRLLKQGTAGLPLCVTVTLVDGLVLARSAFHHSMNYRSVVVLGVAREITDEGPKRAALAALLDHAVPGRAAEARPPNEKELHGTRVLAMPIEEASAKLRTGGPLDDEEDLAWPCWSGMLPLAITPGDPRPTPEGAGFPLPPGLAAWRR